MNSSRETSRVASILATLCLANTVFWSVGWQRKNRVALPCSSWLRALGSIDDSARGALPCGQTGGAQVGLARRKLPALRGEAGTWNVDHWGYLRFQDTLLKLRSVSLHPFIKLPPRIIMLLKWLCISVPCGIHTYCSLLCSFLVIKSINVMTRLLYCSRVGIRVNCDVLLRPSDLLFQVTKEKREEEQRKQATQHFPIWGQRKLTSSKNIGVDTRVTLGSRGLEILEMLCKNEYSTYLYGKFFLRG